MAKDSIQWLVRKRGSQGFEVTGPFSTKQIQSMVKSGSLDADHELCPENHYWFSLYEKNEMEKFFNGSWQVHKSEITKQDINQPLTIPKRSFFRFEKGDILKLFFLTAAAILIFSFLKILKNLKH